MKIKINIVKLLCIVYFISHLGWAAYWIEGSHYIVAVMKLAVAVLIIILGENKFQNDIDKEHQYNT